eukprot:8843359-Pyramimonas_sp.AAC.1
MGMASNQHQPSQSPKPNRVTGFSPAHTSSTTTGTKGIGANVGWKTSPWGNSSGGGGGLGGSER